MGQRKEQFFETYHQPPLILRLPPLQTHNDILVDQVLEKGPRVDGDERHCCRSCRMFCRPFLLSELSSTPKAWWFTSLILSSCREIKSYGFPCKWLANRATEMYRQQNQSAGEVVVEAERLVPCVRNSFGSVLGCDWGDLSPVANVMSTTGRSSLWMSRLEGFGDLASGKMADER